MSMWDTIKWIIGFPGLVAYGAHIVIDAPPQLKLRRHECENIDLRTEKFHHGLLNIRTVHFQYKCNNGWHTGYLKIDLDQKLIEGYEPGWIFSGGKNGTSGDLGVLMLTWPILILLTPTLYLFFRHYEQMEKKRGLSRRHYTFLDAIKGHVDQETEALLKEVFSNEWDGKPWMARLVTLEQAKKILRECRLYEKYIPARIKKEPYCVYEELHDFYWSDDRGRSVANGKFYGQRHSVYILDSRFEGKEADELSKCYKERIFKDLSDEK